ncbi:MAG TPA: hypothetical protein VFA76_10625 [Terriglobales bacterium]|nr:hypothetical protein [Terriglobales bacterium]
MTRCIRKAAALLLTVLAITSLAAGEPADTVAVDPNLVAGLRWRLIGPFRGGRVLAVAGITGQPNTYYFGSVAGGVWKTSDAGQVWVPIFDQQHIASIGALAIASSDPNVIYVGTGEADMRSNISFGDGVYKSSDGGKTWANVGLRDTRHIGRILVDPKNPNIVLVAALGHAYGPSADRGVFRSADGGKTWQKVLYKDENTGAVDLAADPDNPQTVYASLWRTRRPPWSTYPPLGGQGIGLYRSKNGGATWTELSGRGLPAAAVGRIGVAVAAGTHGNRVYAIVDAKDGGGLYRSDNGGENWSLASKDPRIHGRGWYFGTVTIDPKDSDTVYIPNVTLYRSSDGGKTFTALKGGPGGDDYHLLWIDPNDPNRMILGCDQGAVISVDRGKTWSSWYNQPTAQFYHVAVDNQFPYRVYGAQQDSGTVSITSRSDYGRITFRDWYSVGAGEAGYIAPDPSDPNIVYGGDTYGELFRFDKKTGQSQTITAWPAATFGTPISERKLRFTWTSPLVFSPQDSHTIYLGSQYVLKTTDRGNSWERISPDLTGTQPGASSSGPLAVENARARGYGVVYTIAPSPVRENLIWAGTDTGLVQVTLNGGKTWENVSPPGLEEWSKISLIEASRFDAGVAYAAVDRHRLDDYRPYIYRTRDYGKTWTRISDGIPAPAYVHAVREDAVRKGLLFAGTETGVYVSFDDGDHWQALQLNLPIAPIHDLVVKDNDLVVATHGRSFWILDDIAPLREIVPQLATSDVHLFRPVEAVHVRRNENRDTPLPSETPAGENPPAGAIIDYYLKSPPAEEITLEVRDPQGKVVRRYSSKEPKLPSEPAPPLTSDWVQPPARLRKGTGMNRFVWDLRYPAPDVLQHEYPISAIPGNTPPGPEGPLALPGQYEISLTVGSRDYREPLVVKMDPRVSVSQADLARQLELELKISDLLSQITGAQRQILAVRTQLNALRSPAAVGRGSADLNAAVSALDKKLESTAGSPGEEAAPQQTLRGVSATLAGLVSGLDGADAAPTQQAVQVFDESQVFATRLLSEWQQIQQTDLGALNHALQQNHQPEITVPPAPVLP